MLQSTTIFSTSFLYQCALVKKLIHTSWTKTKSNWNCTFYQNKHWRDLQMGQTKQNIQTDDWANDQVLLISAEFDIQFVKLEDHRCGDIVEHRRDLNNSPYFKESLQVVNLSKGHGHQHQSFKEGPKHNSAVCVVIDWRKKTKLDS